MNILCTICARGGSKGVKNKNLIPVNKKPLIYHTINVAKEIKNFDEIIISSDSKKIIEIGKYYKIQNTILRPKKFSRDNSAKIPAIRHALLKIEKIKKKKFDIIVDLDVTAPLKTKKDIIEALKKFINGNYSTLFSVTDCRKNPYYNCIEIKNNKITPIKKKSAFFTSRQETPRVYDMNAAISIWKRNVLLKNNSLFTKKTGIYLMPQYKSFDIDTKLDLEIVKFLFNKKNIFI